MIRFFLQRLALFIPTMFLMSIVAFAIILAPPGDFLTDYVAQLQSQGTVVKQAQLDALERRYGLDQPVHVQYLKWIWGVLHWDMGLSLEFQLPVAQLLNERLLLTVVLGLLTVLFTWTMAIPIGILSAVKQYSFIDQFFTILSYLGVGTPNFMLALILMWLALSLFGMNLTGMFSQGYVDASWSIGRVLDLLKHIWLPVLIIGTDGTARFTRIVRANLLDELGKPYVETALSKGLPKWKAVLKYPVRLALNPFVSTAGWALPELLSGSLIVATVMSLPTLGPLLLRALLSQDQYMAGSIVLILTGLTLIGTLISDLVLAWMDPRIRMGA